MNGVRNWNGCVEEVRVVQHELEVERAGRGHGAVNTVRCDAVVRRDKGMECSVCSQNVRKRTLAIGTANTVRSY